MSLFISVTVAKTYQSSHPCVEAKRRNLTFIFTYMYIYG